MSKKSKTELAVREPVMPDLPVLKDAVNHEYEQYQRLEQSAAKIAVRIGLLLISIREQLPHGSYMDWVEQNLSVSYRSSVRFASLAEMFIETNLVKGRTRKELLLLAAPEGYDPAGDHRDHVACEQLLLRFIGDQSQSDLFAKYGIHYQNQRGGDHRDPNKPPPTPEEKVRVLTEVATRDWNQLGQALLSLGQQRETWKLLPRTTRQTLVVVLRDVASRIAESLKG